MCSKAWASVSNDFAVSHLNSLQSSDQRDRRPEAGYVGDSWRNQAFTLRTGIMSDMAMFQQLTWPSIEMLP